MRIKCYYEILGIRKDANEDEIKRAYKKMAIKFHPDKNQSVHAADAFKKVIKFFFNYNQISHSFTTLKDPEKKEFYDKYGPEEEVREKYHQQQQRYHQEEMDPFDLFEMFFSGGNQGFYQQGGRVFRRRREDEADNAQQRQPRQNPKYMVYMQMLPLLVLILFSVIPYLFQSVIFILIYSKQKPYYQFSMDEEFYKKMTTSINKIEYFVGDRYLKAFNNVNLVKNVRLIK